MTHDKIIEIAYAAGLERVVYVHKDGTRTIEMPRLDLLKRFAALAQQAEPVQEPAFHGFMSDDGTQVDVCFSPSAPRRDGTYATAYYTAPPQQAEPLNQCGETCERAKLCATCARALDQQMEPVAWMYKAESWFDGDSWHETYEVTTDERLAKFKDKNARALCFVEK